MHLIEDTRQKLGKHELKHNYWQKLGVNMIRSVLPFGDYAFISPVVVDTKKDIYEMAYDLFQDHDRFRKECIKARNAKCQLVVLIENTDGVDNLESLKRWVESIEHYKKRRGKRRISGERMVRTMTTMTERYGVLWEFCTPNESGRRVIELLEAGK